MEPFVQMPLGTYDTLKFNNEYLKRRLKEYKKHQEKANERRYRSGEESWHRGSVVAKKK